MTDHASLLRQIRTEARPYVEHALELSEVFVGFRKLASENGLDWGVIKALIKAEIQDEKEGGSVKVDRIIEKADFASAYADMLGLGTKMNENNFSSEIHREPSNRDVSTDGKASSAAASQGQAAHAGTGSETLASHEGDTRGEAVRSDSNGTLASPLISAPPTADQGLDSIGIPLPKLLSSPNSLTSSAFLTGASERRPTETETGDPVALEAASAGVFSAGKSPDPSHHFPDIPAFLRRTA